MFTGSENYCIHKINTYFCIKKIETTSKRLSPTERGEGKKINQGSMIKSDRWHPILERIVKQGLSEEAILKRWSWGQNGQKGGSNLKTRQKVTQVEGRTKAKALRWEARMSLECLRKKKASAARKWGGWGAWRWGEGGWLRLGLWGPCRSR